MSCVHQGYSMSVTKDIKFGVFSAAALTDPATESCQHHPHQEPDVSRSPPLHKDGQTVI